MAITDEQAESDAAKVKALRTSVGWFSSPACSLIYQTSKYVALFSSKGYAIGANFAQWLAHKLKTTEERARELIDGANSQQKEILAQLLYRRDKETGKLESMAMSIDEIADKTSVGQQAKFKSALASIAEAWDEAAELELLDDGSARCTGRVSG